MIKEPSVASIVGPWSGEATTSLIERCKESWNTPLSQLSDLMVATFLAQRIALPEMVNEAERRLASQPRDDTEYYDGQLEATLSDARRFILGPG
jgi:hypothetical protein